MSIRVILTVLILIFIFPFVSFAEYWVASDMKVYHFPGCGLAVKIKPENKVVFKDLKSAIKAGYVPCNFCKPPTR